MGCYRINLIMKNSHILIMHIFFFFFYACNSNGSKIAKQIEKENVILSPNAKSNNGDSKNNTRHNMLCFVAETFGKIAYLYERPNGKIVDTLYASNDSDYYVSVELKNIQSDYADVVASYVYGVPDTLIHTGWIKTSHLGIYVSKSAGNENETVYLFSSPSVNSEIVDSVLNPIWGDTFKVCDFKDGWIQTIYNEKKCWISPDDQEPNNAMPSCI